MNHEPTSDLLSRLVASTPDEPVDLKWLLGHLDTRSFGLILLILGLLTIIPGVATIATMVMLFPAVEMMLGNKGPSFPEFIAKREFDFKRFKRFTGRAMPFLIAIERVSMQRWNVSGSAVDRMVGALVFLLALTALWPLPLVNVVPGIAIAVIAVAYLQKDGVLLVAAAFPAAVWLASFGWTVWASVGVVISWLGW